MKTPAPLRLTLLNLAPVLGLVVLAWQGAHRPEKLIVRPEKLIVGKWRAKGTPDTVVFRADGTYEALVWYTVYPVGKPITVASRSHLSLWRLWGLWSFPDKNHLLMRLGTKKGEGQLLSGCGVGFLDENSDGVPGARISIQGDVAHVRGLEPGGPTWIRVKS